MTGIAFGNLNIPKISMGNTEIKKVSMGDTLVWPVVDATVDYIQIIATTSGVYTTGNPVATPTGVDVGDVVVLVNSSTNSTTSIPAAQTPTGWTQKSNIGFSGHRQIVSCIVVTESNYQSTVDLMGGNSGRDYAFIHLRAYNAGGVKVTPVSVISLDPQTYGGAGPVPQHVLTASDNITLLLAAYNGDSTNAWNTTFIQGITPAQQGVLGVENVVNRCYVKYRVPPMDDLDTATYISMSDVGARNIITSIGLTLASS